MIAFSLKVLSSVIFWIFFFGIGFIFGSIIMKKIAPRTYKFFTTGDRHRFLYSPEIFFILIGCYIFWPIILFIIVTSWFLVKIFRPTLGKAIEKAANIVPDIEIKRK